jgi:hypothetical protein
MFFSGVCIDLFISGMGGSAAVLGYILGHMETGALHLLAGLRFCCERERERVREREVLTIQGFWVYSRKFIAPVIII